MSRSLLLIPAFLVITACPKEAAAPAPAAAPAAQNAPAQRRGSIAELKEGDVVATVKGQPVYAREILDKVRAGEIKAKSEYLSKVAQAREQALKSLVMDRILMDEAKKAGLATVEEYVKAEAEKGKKAVDEPRMRQLYARLVPPGGPAFEEVRMELAQAALQEDRQLAVAGLVDRVLKENDVKWLLPAPKLPRLDISADDDPFLGDKDAKVTIVEFSDFQCPYCSRAAEALHQLVDKYKGKVRVVYRDFPLSFHKEARTAAIAANCAHEQGRFWQFHDTLFKNQNALEEKALKTYARVAGVDGEKFDACLASDKYKAEVEKDYKDGEAVGVEGTPTFFINGRLYTGDPSSVEAMAEAVDAALAEG